MGLDLDHLLPAIAQGDADAFGAFLAGVDLDVRRSLRAFARQVDVEAVLQEAYLRVWTAAPRIALDGRPNALARFTARVAKNLAIDETRRRRETLSVDGSLEVPALEIGEVDPLLRELIAGCFDKLPKQPRAAIEARIESAGGESDVTIAENMGVRLNTFLQNVTRGRKLLSECLEAQGVALGGAT